MEKIHEKDIQDTRRKYEKYNHEQELHFFNIIEIG